MLSPGGISWTTGANKFLWIVTGTDGAPVGDPLVWCRRGDGGESASHGYWPQVAHVVGEAGCRNVCSRGRFISAFTFSGATTTGGGATSMPVSHSALFGAA